MRLAYLAIVSSLAIICSSFAVTSEELKVPDILTYHYDNWRTGWNDKETGLTPGKVKDGTFGLLYNVANLDEQIDAQPLILSNFLVNGQSKNVMLIATEYNTLYAIDADTGAKIASRSLGAPVPKFALCGNGSDHLGINSTPVINNQRDTLYVIAAVWSGSLSSLDYVLHAVDLTSIGDQQHPFADKTQPVTVTASAKLTDGSIYQFQAQYSRQRSALLLSHDRVYAGFATMCDSHAEASRGWLLGWDAKSLAPLEPELTDRRPTPDLGGRLGAIWMSGYGPAVDENGDIFLATGNSIVNPFETSPVPPSPTTYLSDSVIRFSPDLKVLDWFIPSDPVNGQNVMDMHDRDLGSGGVLLLPDDDATRPLGMKLAVAGGKTGQMYLLDRSSLGKFDPAGVNHVLDVQDIGPCWCGPSYFEGADGAPRIVSSGNGIVSGQPANGHLMVWRIQSSGQSPKFVQEYASPEPLGTTYFQGGFFTSVSSNGKLPESAVIWAVRRPQMEDPLPQSLTLYAFDAKDGTRLCRADAGPWPTDKSNGAAANSVPVVWNHKVIVASYKELRVFGSGGTPACGVDMAQIIKNEYAAHATEAAQPSQDQFVDMKGTIVNVSGDKLQLKSNGSVMDVDITNVMKSGRYGTLDVGKPVTVRGVSSADGKLTAESVHSGN